MPFTTLTRAASQPSAGAFRVGIDVSLANIIVFFASQTVPPDILPDVENLVVIVVAAGLAYLGKVMRDSNIMFGNLI